MSHSNTPSQPSAPEIEAAPSPAVSSLRSRFEQLAVEASIVAATQRPPSSNSFLAAEPPSTRPRAMSNSSQHSILSNGSQHSLLSSPQLRPASSSSDLKTTRKPPPPPPGRGASPVPPSPRSNASPRLQPQPAGDHALLIPDTTINTEETISVSSSRSALLRKPPPVPSHHAEARRESQVTERTDVSMLVSKFGSGPPPVPSSSRPVPSATRVFSHTAATQPSHGEAADQSRRPRHSFPVSVQPPSSSSSSSNASTSSLSPSSQNPFGDDVSDSDRTSVPTHPPPLPSRRNGKAQERATGHNTREVSSDSLIDMSSEESSDTDVSATQTAAAPRPPRPPPRPKSGLHTGTASSSASSSTSSLPPPPLPARRFTMPLEDAATRPQPPPPPPRPTIPETDLLQVAEPASPILLPSERRTIGVHRPPPVRKIGPGDKLPLPLSRRPPSGSSEDSEDEESEIRKVELLPDTSRASRRPPTIDCHNYTEFNIHIPAYVGVIAVSGHTVAIATHHHLKLYDLSVSDGPILNLDSKDLGLDKLNGFKVTAMEFRPADRAGDRGAYLWVGTKDGHLLELDVRSGSVVGLKPLAHAHTVTHMFRHGLSMVTVDDTGKVLVWTPPLESTEDVRLGYTQPRTMRASDKQDFVKLIGQQLWMSSRDPGNGGGTAINSRAPMIRVYDVFTPGSSVKSVLPTEHLGAVTSGTILPTEPDHVYLGHEGGHVSVWDRASEDGVPVCIDVIKVAASDVMSLEGVNDKLWAGARNGMISAYDVSQKPWTVTNRWQAHGKLPVLRLAVDTWSIEKLNRLMVYSIGRDEKMRFWDGLLGIDWVEQEMLKRETEFSAFRDMTVLLVSWNVDSAKPDALTGTSENLNFLHDVLTSVEPPDIISFGLQELIDLESRKMAAKTVLLGGKNKNADGAISQKVTTSYKKWYDRLLSSVKQFMPPDLPYTVIHTENLVGLFSCIFVKDTERTSLKNVAITTVKRGMGGRYGNKGGIVARFVIDDTSICFINCHLAAGQHHVRQRNADVAAIVEDKTVFPESDALEGPLAYVNGGDGSMVLDHEVVFMSGDMNYRIDQRRDFVTSHIKAGDLQALYAHDQLLKEMQFNRGFRLRSFTEGPLTFAPTYKYDRRSIEYDTSEKSRCPAWCDRVLWRSRVPERVQQLHYRRHEVDVSDHRPISAAFRVTVKSVAHDARAAVQHQVLAAWAVHEHGLLQAAHQFFVEQKMI